MACKCRLIRWCEEDIQRVQEIQNKLSSALSDLDGLSGLLSSLGIDCSAVLQLPNSPEIEDCIKRINDAPENKLHVHIEQCSKHISRLQSDIQNLRSEDWAYHDES